MGFLEAMEGAYREASVSTCVRRKVGAVLLDSDGRERGRGHNTEVNGLECQTDCPRGKKTYQEIPAGSPYGDCISTHAEMMALRKVNVHVDEMEAWTMVITCEPCNDCRLVLDDLGILTVFDEPLVKTVDVKGDWL